MSNKNSYLLEFDFYKNRHKANGNELRVCLRFKTVEEAMKYALAEDYEKFNAYYKEKNDGWQLVGSGRILRDSAGLKCVFNPISAVREGYSANRLKENLKVNEITVYAPLPVVDVD